MHTVFAVVDVDDANRGTHMYHETTWSVTLSLLGAMQVIWVAKAKTKKEQEALFKKARTYEIDGPNVAKWARWLSEVCVCHVPIVANVLIRSP